MSEIDQIKKLLGDLAGDPAVLEDFERDPAATVRRYGLEPPPDCPRPLQKASPEYYTGVLHGLEGGQGFGDPHAGGWWCTVLSHAGIE